MLKPLVFIAGNKSMGNFCFHKMLEHHSQPSPRGSVSLLYPDIALGLSGFVGGRSFSLPSSPGEPPCHSKEAPPGPPEDSQDLQKGKQL